jgi:hypothetical protein
MDFTCCAFSGPAKETRRDWVHKHDVLYLPITITDTRTFQNQLSEGAASSYFPIHCALSPAEHERHLVVVLAQKTNSLDQCRSVIDYLLFASMTVCKHMITIRANELTFDKLRDLVAERFEGDRSRPDVSCVFLVVGSLTYW